MKQGKSLIHGLYTAQRDNFELLGTCCGRELTIINVQRCGVCAAPSMLMFARSGDFECARKAFAANEAELFGAI